MVGMGGVASRFLPVICLVSIALVVGCGGAPTAKRSEGARQVAYPAVLGQRKLAAVRVDGGSQPRASDCLAGVTRIGSSRIATAALVTKNAIVRKAPDARAAVVAHLRPLNRHGLPEVLH